MTLGAVNTTAQMASVQRNRDGKRKFRTKGLYDTGTIIGKNMPFVKTFFPVHHLLSGPFVLRGMRYLYYSMSMSPVRSVSNILVVKPGAIGDLLQLTPVLRALKGRYPSSRITLLAGSGASVRLFQNNPHVYETLVYEKHGEHRQAASFLRLWAEIRKRRFDLVLNFQRSNLKIWLLTTAAFPCRVLVYHRSDRPGLHAVENYLETIEPLGISIATPGLDLELFPGQEDRSFADTVLKVVKSGTKPLIALNPGASHAVNRWDTAQFAELGNLLADRLGAKLVLIGAKRTKISLRQCSGTACTGTGADRQDVSPPTGSGARTVRHPGDRRHRAHARGNSAWHQGGGALWCG